jgi:hypothetical protein
MSGLGIFKSVISAAVGGSFTSVYTTPTGKASYLIQCDVACIGDTGVQATIKLVKSVGGTAHLVKNVPIPVGSTLQVLDGQKVVLESGDSLQVKCETDGETVDVIVSLVEDVNL